MDPQNKKKKMNLKLKTETQIKRAFIFWKSQLVFVFSILLLILRDEVFYYDINS